jgi:hypothetical protein
MQFRSIVTGSLKSRATDRYGSGQFHAGRTKGKKHHEHQGLDVQAKPNESIFSPIDGDIIREAVPYPPFTGVVIRGKGAYAGYEVKLFYVQGYFSGHVTAGTPIGVAEDLSIKYPGITNHVHLEVRSGGKVVPPFDVYQMCF